MKKILVIDDNEAHLMLVDGILREYYKVYPVSSADVALSLLKKQHPDLILLDLDMPAMSGIDFMRIIKMDKNLYDIPVIFLTIMSDTDNEARAFELGAVDYIHKPINKVVLIARVKLHLELEAYRKNLEGLVEVRTSQVMQLQRIIINLLGCVNEFRDRDTGNHVDRTSDYVTAILDALAKKQLSRQYRIPKPYYEDIKHSAQLHDLGKISIPDAVLMKPGPLTHDEFELMKTHVSSGAELLRRAIREFNGPSFLDTALEIIMTHHEKWDGSGYPNHLSGDDIPISGRIMAIADVYDALTSKRPYKPAYSHEIAIDIIMHNSGSHFDPTLVDIFLEIQDKVAKINELKIAL